MQCQLCEHRICGSAAPACRSRDVRRLRRYLWEDTSSFGPAALRLACCQPSQRRSVLFLSFTVSTAAPQVSVPDSLARPLPGRLRHPHPPPRRLVRAHFERSRAACMCPARPVKSAIPSSVPVTHTSLTRSLNSTGCAACLCLCQARPLGRGARPARRVREAPLGSVQPRRGGLCGVINDIIFSL